MTTCDVNVPNDVRAIVGRGDWARLPRGGSAALSYRWRAPGRDLYVKAIGRRQPVVDGHEPVTLIRRAQQVRLIHRRAPALRAVVPEVEVVGTRDHVVLTSRWIGGSSPVDLLLAGDVEAFDRRVRTLLDLIGAEGYGTSSVTATAAAAHALYGDRLRRRLKFIHASVPGWLAAGGTPSLTDGDQTHRDARPAASRLVAVVDRLSRAGDLLPRRLWFPVHGDMNLLNVIIDESSGTLVLVDQRGTCAPWDPAYDLGKVLLSLTIHVGLEDGFLLPPAVGPPRCPPIGRGSAPVATASLMATGVQRFRSAIAEWGFGSTVEPRPGLLWRRVLFAHAVHALCESACRISVARTRSVIESDREMVKAEAYYRYGARCLDEIAEGYDDAPMPGTGDIAAWSMR